MYWSGSHITPRKWQKEVIPLAISELRRGRKVIVSAIMGSGKSVVIGELCYIALRKLKQTHKIIVTAPRQNLVVQLGETISDRCGVERVGLFYQSSKDTSHDIIVTCNASVPLLAKALRASSVRVALLIGDEVHGSESAVFKQSFSALSPASAIGFTATPYRSIERESLSLWDGVVYRYSAADALKDGVIVPFELSHWTGDSSWSVDRCCGDMIYDLICKNGPFFPGIVSAISIEDAEYYAEYLRKSHRLKAAAIHSRLGLTEREKRLNDLRYGDLDVLVHVSLLSEGVNMPWLRWLCLRRPVRAKVRFVQEVGRVLRSYKGKEKAIILDPHDLFTLHGLNHPESIGEVEPNLSEYEEELASLEKDEQVRMRVREMPPVKAFSEIESWVKNILASMEAHKMASEYQGMELTSKWRGGLPTPRQIETLKNMKTFCRYIPKKHRESFKSLIDHSPNLTRGVCYNMISILKGIAKESSKRRRWDRYWHWPNKCPIPNPNFGIQLMIFAMDNND